MSSEDVFFYNLVPRVPLFLEKPAVTKVLSRGTESTKGTTLVFLTMEELNTPTKTVVWLMLGEYSMSSMINARVWLLPWFSLQSDMTVGHLSDLGEETPSPCQHQPRTWMPQSLTENKNDWNYTAFKRNKYHFSRGISFLWSMNWLDTVSRFFLPNPVMLLS